MIFRYLGQYESRTKQAPAKQTERVTEQLRGILTVVKSEGSGGGMDIKVGDSKAKFANLTVSKSGPRYKCKEGGVLVNTSCGEYQSRLHFYRLTAQLKR